MSEPDRSLLMCVSCTLVGSAAGSTGCRFYRELSIVRSKTEEFVLLSFRYRRRATDKLKLWLFYAGGVGKVCSFCFVFSCPPLVPSPYFRQAQTLVVLCWWCRQGVQLLLCIQSSSTGQVMLITRCANFVLCLCRHILVKSYLCLKGSRVLQV